MKTAMDRSRLHDESQRALALGCATDRAALPELIMLLSRPTAEIRRQAASAIGKLSGFGVDPAAAAAALAPVALRDGHPQVRQYALKALKGHGAAAEQHLHDLDDLAADPKAHDCVRVAALAAAREIPDAAQLAVESAEHRCQKCRRAVEHGEYARSQKAFQRTYCDHGFDTVFLRRFRNWETQGELQKTVQASDGTVVQSDGERIIAEELVRLGITHCYENRFRMIKGYAIRPDFYLPEHDLYVEYWGMEDNRDYRIGMLEKKKLYQQAGKKLVSLYAHEKPRLAEVLRAKLALQMRLPKARPPPHPRHTVSTSESESTNVHELRSQDYERIYL